MAMAGLQDSLDDKSAAKQHKGNTGSQWPEWLHPGRSNMGPSVRCETMFTVPSELQSAKRPPQGWHRLRAPSGSAWACMGMSSSRHEQLTHDGNDSGVLVIQD